MGKPVVDKTILIDDSDIDLFIQRRFLEVYNFSQELMLFKSAGEALHKLSSINGDTSPDLIFLDLNMPEMDGFSFLKRFSDLPESVTSRSKIVVLTSSNSFKDKEQALTFRNVIHFITKPLKQADLEELKTLIHT